MRAARLSVTEGKERGREIPIERESVLLGRGDTADFTVDDERMSRHHVRIAWRGGDWFADDLGSSNGTRVNGKRVSGFTTLRHGDEIRVGRTSMKFELLDELPPPISAAPRVAAVAERDLVGRVIGGYAILEEIGRGAVGVVYRARQTSLDREVALKVLSPRFAGDPAFVRRFIGEAHAAARLSHPNVVQVYDAGQDQGLDYFSMELMRGGSVETRLASLPNGRFSVHAALSVVLDAARGLEFAESCGIIHRDIKPDNLMLTAEQTAKIGDLGIAVQADDSNVTRMGTPQYLAPEVVRGEPPSAASDIYALGATLYRMLSGRNPYDATSAAETLRKVREEAPLRISSVAPGLPRAVVDLTESMMARRPQDRPRSAGQVVSAIEGMRFEREVRKAERAAAGGPHGWLWTITFGVTAGVALGAVVVVVLLQATTRPSRVAVTAPASVEAPEDAAPETDPALAPAREAFAAVLRRETALGAVDLPRRTQWQALVADYDRVAAVFPTATRQVAAARKRSAFITAALARLDESASKAGAEAERRWNEVRAGIAAHESAQEWAESIDLAAQTLSESSFEFVRQRVPDSLAFLQGTPDRVVALARRSLDDVVAKARVMMSLGDFPKAFDSVKQWAERTRPHVGTTDALTAMLKEAQDWVRVTRGDEIKRLTTALQSDLDRAMPALAGSSACPGPRCALRFADAQAGLRNALVGATTGAVKRRLARRLARLTAADAAWSTFIVQFARGDVLADGADVGWVPGHEPSVPAKLALAKPPSAAGFSYDLVLQGASARRTLAWSDLPADSFAENLLTPTIARASADDAKGLLWLCIELRQPIAAGDCLERAALTGDELAAAQAEIEALRDWQRASGGGSPAPADVVALRRRHGATDAVLTLGSKWRPTVADVIAGDELNAYFDNWGVERR